MLDTIRLKYPISPTPEQLIHWTQKISVTETGTRNIFVYNPQIDETTLRYTYYPEDYKGNPLLALEFSLPKLIFDNNYTMISSIDGAVKIGNIVLNDVPNVPKLGLEEGILIRLDMCYNHQVGESVNDYIKALGSLDYPHRRTKHHRFEGVEYRAKHKTTKFYNKQTETGCVEAFGILRQETTLLDNKDIQKMLGKVKPTLLDITPDCVQEYLQSDLEKLGLLNNSIGNHDTALETLTDMYGEYAGIYLFGLQAAKMNKSKKLIRQEIGMHPRSLDRQLKKIVDAGIPITLTDLEEPLPPLRIEL
jgi:hypothetical protein